MTGTHRSPDSSLPQYPGRAPTRVVLARHGRTALNAAGRLRGLADPPLDAIGEVEADLLGEQLARYAPREVRCSPLLRAVSTARAVAAAVGLTAVVDARLNDRDYGPWTGHLKSEVDERWGSTDLAPGVESTSAVLARAWPALVDAAAVPGVTVMITHDAIIRPLLTRVLGSPPERDTQTAHWNELSLDDGRWSVTGLDLGPAT